MKIFTLLLLCTVLQTLTVSQGNKIMKALSDVSNGNIDSKDHRHHRHHRHHHGRHHQRRGEGGNSDGHQRKTSDKKAQKQLRKEMRVGLDMNAAMLSSRVSFALEKPKLPPWEVRIDADQGFTKDPIDMETLQEHPDEGVPVKGLKSKRQEGLKEGGNNEDNAERQSSMKTGAKSIDDHMTLKSTLTSSPLAADDDGGSGELPGYSAEDLLPVPASKSRERRSTGHYVQVPVCQSTSEWVERSHAEDMWGNTVEVLQEIDIGGARVHQYFYETYCREERASCVGIDTSRFLSECKNKHVWAYAKIRTLAGDQGWNLIKIRGSCNCALYSKNPGMGLDILELIGKR